MRDVLIAATVAGILLVGVARADLEEGTFAPDITAKDWLNTEGEPISLYELRGMVVVLYFWVSWHESGEAFMPVMNLIENHPNLGRKRGVFVIGVTEADRARIEETIQEERIFFPIALECKAAEEYKITSFPRVVVIGPTGKIVYSGWPGAGAKQLVDKMIETFEETPPFRTHPREAVAARRLLDEAREAILAADYRRAFLRARSADGHALTDDRLKVRCQEMLDLLEALARDELARGVQLIDAQKYDEGVAVLRDVIERFRVLRNGKIARKRLKKLKETYPEVQRALEKSERETEVRHMLATAVESLWDRSLGAAYETLKKIVADFAETPAAASAKAILRRMEANDAIMGHVRDYQGEKACTSLLAQGRSFAATGQYERARDVFRRIIDGYPGTIYWEQAYQELEKLPRQP